MPGRRTVERMVVAASTVSIVLFVAGVVVLGFLAAGALNLMGSSAERIDPTGHRVKDPPGMRKPPNEGGLL
jgi:hypothetical protein